MKHLKLTEKTGVKSLVWYLCRRYTSVSMKQMQQNFARLCTKPIQTQKKHRNYCSTYMKDTATTFSTVIKMASEPPCLFTLPLLHTQQLFLSARCLKELIHTLVASFSQVLVAKLALASQIAGSQNVTTCEKNCASLADHASSIAMKKYGCGTTVYASGSASVRLLRVRQACTVQNARNCSAVSLHMQYSEKSSSVRTFLGTPF